MKSRIRGAAVIVHGDGIVFARHHDPHRNLTWWSPPGGGVDGQESILVAAEREALEETSLRVVADRPIYAQDLWSEHRNTRSLELFILCHLADSETIDNLRADNEIDEVRIITRATSTGELILPEVFSGTVWDDLDAGFPAFRYLGMTEL